MFFLTFLFMVTRTFSFFFSSRRRHTRSKRDWSSDVCSSDLGLTWFSEQGEKLVYRTARQFKDLPSEDRGADVFAALFGALVAFIGFPGSLAADAIKAAISRQREFLADAASVQFTRHPEAI